ncbi:MAG: DUF4838 domain-containing protein [Armatimonadota bacterium]|jgi:hypothetical protein
MVKTLILLTLACAFHALSGSVHADELTLVDDGRPAAVVAIRPDAESIVREAADELREHLRLASGAELPLIETEDPATLPAEMAHLVVGADLARSLGVDVDDLAPEEYIVRTIGRRIVFAGHDLGGAQGGPTARVTASAATMWAVQWFLDRQLGVRWLWPGEAGTYVPELSTIVAPDLDVRERPALQQRRLRTFVHREPADDRARLVAEEQRLQLAEETDRWKYRHQMGSRSTFGFGHAFGQWWERYGEEHPEYFATPPEGASPMRTDRAKLCVSNPAVAERIIEEWKAAGAPDNWNVCPNDGSGFCTCDDCRAMDDPPDQDPDAIWRGRANLTARYVKLWNRLITQMREINPDVTISSYAYSAYREPPVDLTLEPGIVLGMVHTYHAFDEWQGWSDAGAQLFLRPNWWHMGGPAPHIPLSSQGGYFLFAREHAMVGFDFDSLLGFWGTQGPLYYLIARLGYRDDMSVDDVIAEYASAFGAAGPAVEEYLRFWDDFADRAVYAVPAGGVVSVDPDGLYETAIRQYEMNPHPIASSWPILPALYTDELLAEAEAILDRAEAADASAQVRARVAFLRDGLTHLRLTRDTVALADPRFRPEGATEADFTEAAARLQEFRRERAMSHVAWGEAVNDYEIRRRLPTGLAEAGWIETEGL